MSIVPPFTIDSDLVLDLQHCISHAPIKTHLETLGYSLRDGQPGLYQAPNLPKEAQAAGGVDLFVPAADAIGKHRRDANIPGDPGAARRQRGLELAIIDRSTLIIHSLDPRDTRTVEALVAGPAALLAAKLIKIGERLRSGRVEPKDVLDVYRILSSRDAAALAETLRLFRDHKIAGPIIVEAVTCMHDEFTGDTARALRLLEQYLDPYPIKAEVVEATRLLTEELLAALGS
ncbi:hypothetical protein EPN52_10035 [bacterium]|nr:MAG: hypothetical protein EPN52_10035 [bacterium]